MYQVIPIFIDKRVNEWCEVSFVLVRQHDRSVNETE